MLVIRHTVSWYGRFRRRARLPACGIFDYCRPPAVLGIFDHDKDGDGQLDANIYIYVNPAASLYLAPEDHYPQFPCVAPV